MFFYPHLPSLESHWFGSMCALLHLKFPTLINMLPFSRYAMKSSSPFLVGTKKSTGLELEGLIRNPYPSGHSKNGKG